MNKTLKEILQNFYGEDLAEAIIDSYKDIEEGFIFKKWKLSELDASHFVENIRRIIEKELFGTDIPIGINLKKFDDQELTRYENASSDDSFRILVPRVLKSVYGLRNKRGVGHPGKVSPNRIDATYIFYSVKWILCEIVRLKTNLPIEQTEEIIDSLIERKIDLIWDEGDTLRVLNNKIKTENQILILLYCKGVLSNKKLMESIEYTNFSVFCRILKSLHKKRYVEYSPNGDCKILPPGVAYIEEIIIKNKK
jgi:hypothetical protein